MRPTLLLAPTLFALLMSGCVTLTEQSPSKHISQAGALKVHPGLLGRPVPAELMEAPLVSKVAAEAPMKMDETGLRTQRSVYFDLDSAAIKADYNPALQAHARYLAAHPSAKVRIEGNADERGSASYNNLLAAKRAESVKQTIVGHGATEKQVVIKSYGESRPKLKGRDEESWAENRRADIVYERED